jgi:hypothetical protein
LLSGTATFKVGWDIVLIGKSITEMKDSKKNWIFIQKTLALGEVKSFLLEQRILAKFSQIAVLPTSFRFGDKRA